MKPRPRPELRYRLGCPLAIVVTTALVAATDALVPQRLVSSAGEALFVGAFVGLPFGALALARARDWLAWLVAVVLTIGFWAYIFLGPNPGSTNFMSGLGMTMMPLAIAGASVAVAGMRGRIGWALEGDNPPDNAGRPPSG